jgi:hypothetical protein
MLNGQSTFAGGGGMVTAPSTVLAPGQDALTMSSSPVRVRAAACTEAGRKEQTSNVCFNGCAKQKWLHELRLISLKNALLSVLFYLQPLSSSSEVQLLGCILDMLML